MNIEQIKTAAFYDELEKIATPKLPRIVDLLEKKIAPFKYSRKTDVKKVLDQVKKMKDHVSSQSEIANNIERRNKYVQSDVRDLIKKVKDTAAYESRPSWLQFNPPEHKPLFPNKW